jgi:hypothetical protein
MNGTKNLSDRDVSRSGRQHSANSVVSLDTRRGKPDWERDVVAALVRYSQLADGWDSYGGKPLRSDTGMFALQVLSSVMNEFVPIPSVVPIATGGVQFEWHENNLDIELYIAAPNDSELTVIDHLDGGNVEVTHVRTDLSPLSKSVAKLIDYNRNIGPFANAG